MKTVPNRKAYLLSLLAAGALSPYAVSQDLPGIETQLQGEWIAYRGDQFDIKKITREKATQTFYDWNGNLLYQRTSDLKVKVVGSGERKTIIEKARSGTILRAARSRKILCGQRCLLMRPREDGKKVPPGLVMQMMTMQQSWTICRTNTFPCSSAGSSKFRRVLT